MGQCMSRKAAGAIAASAATAHTRPTGKKMQQQGLLDESPEDDNHKDLSRSKPHPGSAPLMHHNNNNNNHSRGVAMSFGFSKRPPRPTTAPAAPAISANPNAARRLANTTTNPHPEIICNNKDRNGNGNNRTSDADDLDTEPLTSNAASTGRSTPRLMPPKKEGNATRVNRFGFRQPQVNRLNKVADLNNSPAPVEIFNNNTMAKPVKALPEKIKTSGNVDSNKNRVTAARIVPVQAEKYMLQSTQLPRPEPIRLIETKTAKTLANNNKKIASTYHQHEDNSSKDGSLTEDSGVGSHVSGNNFPTDSDLGTMMGVPGIERLTRSPRRNSGYNSSRIRNLEVVRSGNNSFDVRDLDETTTENCVPLPQLPSAFNTTVDENIRGHYHHHHHNNTGFVREMALEYQRHHLHPASSSSPQQDNRNIISGSGGVSNNRRKISVTSSEGFSDDYYGGEEGEEKTYKDRFKSEKTFIKPSAHKTFLKAKPSGDGQLSKDDSNTPSSDEHEWTHGGEAMADEVSFSISSSDESKDKEHLLTLPLNNNMNNISSGPTGPTIVNLQQKQQQEQLKQCVVQQTMNKPSVISLQTLLNAPPMNCLIAKPDVKNALLTIEDPKFAAVAAVSNTMLDDETSPVDSLISCSESEEILKRKLNKSSSNSKDINEKLTPPSPGTPTNASNSLSLSDGKDDFLIDDEIADQPGLLFEDTTGVINNNNNNSISLNNSEGTLTMVDSTPKMKRRTLGAIEGSPLTRNRKLYNSRTGSLDTLSPCESIASDDLMMDYDYSQSSGLEDVVDRNDSSNHGFHSLDETIRPDCEFNRKDLLRDWSSLLGNYTGDKSTKSNAVRNSRLLWSRTTTPNSIPDSPKSLENSHKGTPTNNKSRPSCTTTTSNNNSPSLRLSRPGRLSSSSTTGGGCSYDSDDSVRLDRANHAAIKQDIVGIKTMLLKLRRVLNEPPDEDILSRSETHNPFDTSQSALATNGLFLTGGPTTTTTGSMLDSSGDAHSNQIILDAEEAIDNRMELEELRRQVLFLQGQLEDKEKTVQILQEQMVKLTNDLYTSNSAPASSTIAVHEVESSMCNAATQTERIRPISAGPSLLSNSPVEGNVGSLVSASESPPQRRPRQPPSRLWRKPGAPPSPQRYTNTTTIMNNNTNNNIISNVNNSHSSIPRRANSRTRTPSTPS